MSTQVKCNNLLPSLTMVHQLCGQSATRNFPPCEKAIILKPFGGITTNVRPFHGETSHPGEVWILIPQHLRGILPKRIIQDPYVLSDQQCWKANKTAKQTLKPSWQQCQREVCRFREGWLQSKWGHGMCLERVGHGKSIRGRFWLPSPNRSLIFTLTQVWQ